MDISQGDWRKIQVLRERHVCKANLLRVLPVFKWIGATSTENWGQRSHLMKGFNYGRPAVLEWRGERLMAHAVGDITPNWWRDWPEQIYA